MSLLTVFARKRVFDVPRTSLRVRIRPLHGIGFLLGPVNREKDAASRGLLTVFEALRPARRPPAAPPPVPVMNISLSGIGLLRSALTHWPAPGSAMDGRLVVGSGSHALQLRVAHHTHDIVGCSFVDPPAEVPAAIESHLGTEIEALTMAHLGPEVLPPHDDGTPHAFHGEQNSELFFVERDGRIVHFRLAFLGNYLEGGEGRPVRFGVITREHDLAPEHTDHATVHFLQNIDAGQLAATMRFIGAIPGLTPEQRRGVLRHIY